MNVDLKEGIKKFSKTNRGPRVPMLCISGDNK